MHRRTQRHARDPGRPAASRPHRRRAIHRHPDVRNHGPVCAGRPYGGRSFAAPIGPPGYARLLSTGSPSLPDPRRLSLRARLHRQAMERVLPGDRHGKRCEARSASQQHHVAHQQLRFCLCLVFRHDENPHVSRMDEAVQRSRHSQRAAARPRQPDRRPASGRGRIFPVRRSSDRRHAAPRRTGGDLEQNTALGPAIPASSRRARRRGPARGRIFRKRDRNARGQRRPDPGNDAK